MSKVEGNKPEVPENKKEVEKPKLPEIKNPKEEGKQDIQDFLNNHQK